MFYAMMSQIGCDTPSRIPLYAIMTESGRSASWLDRAPKWPMAHHTRPAHYLCGWMTLKTSCFRPVLRESG